MITKTENLTKKEIAACIKAVKNWKNNWGTSYYAYLGDPPDLRFKHYKELYSVDDETAKKYGGLEAQCLIANFGSVSKDTSFSGLLDFESKIQELFNIYYEKENFEEKLYGFARKKDQQYVDEGVPNNLINKYGREVLIKFLEWLDSFHTKDIDF